MISFRLLPQRFCMTTKRLKLIADRASPFLKVLTANGTYGRYFLIIRTFGKLTEPTDVISPLSLHLGAVTANKESYLR